ncbi:uncharacterized protein Tco025E_05332 [Trypanosoma conorhini]|uniref:Uncharacterized protein n=1 Tax=Trypanosoma conorhini TaxID=83891 RepID=A0A422PE39_9TRYP|nr:uncharacterized protein Tco025E_05332 [Trypanosoma conorhini]RNF15943.1 hypothetical protein Tco025E_05332 [Trypanosoma conorhini]
MWRLSLPLLASSSSFSNSRRHVGREAVFLPWDARPWPSYETHADQWRFLDRTLSAVVGMTPAEVSAKSLRLCPRHLLQEIEDPVLALQRRRQREAQHTPKLQQQQQQQQRRRKSDAAPLSAPAGAHPSCFAQTNNNGKNKAKGGGGALEERGENTTVPRPAPATSASRGGPRINRTQKKRDVTGKPFGAYSGIPTSSTAAAAAPRAPTRLSTSTTRSNVCNNGTENASATRSSFSARPTTAASAAEGRMPGRQPRAEKRTTDAVGEKGETRRSDKDSIKSQSMSKRLTSTVSGEAIKSGEAEEKRVAARESVDLERNNSLAQPPPTGTKQPRSQGKGAKRGKKGQ